MKLLKVTLIMMMHGDVDADDVDVSESLKVSILKIHAGEGLQLHHVFFLERVMVALKRAHSCSMFQ